MSFTKLIYMMTPVIVFFIHENNYFGWNAHAASDSEIIADGLMQVMFTVVVCTVVICNVLSGLVRSLGIKNEKDR